MCVEGTPSRMQLIIAFLKDQMLPDNKDEAYKLRKRLHTLFTMMVSYIKEISLRHTHMKKEVTYVF